MSEENRKSDVLDELPMWVVTDHPSDFPQFYVARKNVWDGNDRYVPTGEMILRATREEIAEEMEAMGLVFVARSDLDDPVILGTWL